MSRQYVEGTSSTVGGSSCSYATLDNYNKSDGMQVPRPTGNATGYIVPDYGAPGYNTLIHGPATCSGYPEIANAYGSKDGNCNQQYVRTMCQ